jgi:hypothetical protein
MCGADLSDLDEENPKDKENNPGKKPVQDKGKESPMGTTFQLLATMSPPI